MFSSFSQPSQKASKTNWQFFKGEGGGTRVHPGRPTFIHVHPEPPPIFTPFCLTAPPTIMAHAAFLEFDAQEWYKKLVEAAGNGSPERLSKLKLVSTLAEFEEHKARQEVCVLDVGCVPQVESASVRGAKDEGVEPRIVQWTCVDCPCTNKSAIREWRCLIGDPRLIRSIHVKIAFKHARDNTLQHVTNHWKNNAHVQRAAGPAAAAASAQAPRIDIDEVSYYRHAPCGRVQAARALMCQTAAIFDVLVFLCVWIGHGEWKW